MFGYIRVPDSGRIFHKQCGRPELMVLIGLGRLGNKRLLNEVAGASSSPAGRLASQDTNQMNVMIHFILAPKQAPHC